MCSVSSWLTSHDISKMCMFTCACSLSLSLSLSISICISIALFSLMLLPNPREENQKDRHNFPHPKSRPSVVQPRTEDKLRGCQHTTTEAIKKMYRNGRNMRITQGPGLSGLGGRLLDKGLTKCSSSPWSEMERQGICSKSKFLTSNSWTRSKTPLWQ